MTESALSIMIMKDGHRMKLYEGNIGATYMVESVHVDEAINRRLEALGVNENTPPSPPETGTNAPDFPGQLRGHPSPW